MRVATVRGEFLGHDLRDELEQRIVDRTTNGPVSIATDLGRCTPECMPRSTGQRPEPESGAGSATPEEATAAAPPASIQRRNSANSMRTLRPT